MSQSDLQVLGAKSGATPERVDFDQPALLGGCCANCSYKMWPRRSVCARCGSRTILEERLGPVAELVTWTKVWTPLPGLEVPYTLGLTTLGSVRIFAHIRGADALLRAGACLVLAVDRESVPMFWFEIGAPEGDKVQ